MPQGDIMDSWNCFSIFCSSFKLLLQSDKKKKKHLPIFLKQKSGIFKGLRTSLAVQWFRICTSTAGGMGSIPGQGTKIPNATWYSQKNLSLEICKNEYVLHKQYILKLQNKIKNQGRKGENIYCSQSSLTEVIERVLGISP